MDGALQGIRILDLTRVLVGPYATMVLADLGADVIKIEMPLRGDDAREFGPFLNGESAYFMSLNRNKRSMTLNLKSEAGKQVFLELVEKVDVVVENFRPGAMERLGLSYENLKAVNPELIYAAASGFGQSGPYSQRPAYDAVVQAMGGIMSITSPVPNGPPTRVGTSIGDITAGLFTAIGILAALRHRDKTGQGQMVDVSMLDCQVAILENAIARYLVTGEIPHPTGNRHPSIAPFEPFDTLDGQIMLAVGNDAIWNKLCEVLDLPDLVNHPLYLTNDLRNQNEATLKPVLADIINGRKTTEWQEIFDEAGIPNGPINTIDRVVEDPQVQSREMIVEVEHPTAGRMKIPGIPIKLSESPGKVAVCAPCLGEQTNEILAEVLGYSEDKIVSLRSEGIF
jgi:CoA:oxalate CoA-transferase